MDMTIPAGPANSAPVAAQLQELKALARRLAPADGEWKTAIPGLSVFRRSSPVNCECSVTRASLVIAAQGEKRVTLAGQSIDYGPGQGLIVAMDLPVMARIVAASPEQPYLSLVYDLDLGEIAALMREMGLSAPRAIPEGPALSRCTVSQSLYDTALRLVRLVENPADIPVLAPLAERELLYRLLTGEQGMRLRHLTLAESQSGKIARAIGYLRRNMTQPLRIGTLAAEVNMSVSSLHHHFKAATSMSPLQFHKQLRLYEARRLLASPEIDVTSAAYSVGYESPSQFSRDYARLFGTPPTRDPALNRAGLLPQDRFTAPSPQPVTGP